MSEPITEMDYCTFCHRVHEVVRGKCPTPEAMNSTSPPEYPGELEREPLPCPFCGGTAKVFTREAHDTTPEPRRTLYWYVCNTYSCGVSVTHGQWSETAALEKWNKRSQAGRPR